MKLMSLLEKQISLGDLTLIVYDFAELGDVLPMHSHNYMDNHITIVARGSFKVCGKNWEKTADEGTILDWSEGQEHEFTSLSANARLVNVRKHFFNRNPIEQVGTVYA